MTSRGAGEIAERIRARLCRASTPLSAEDLLKEFEDRRTARRVVGEMVRRGLVERLPDYEGRRMVFRAKRGACAGEA